MRDTYIISGLVVVIIGVGILILLQNSCRVPLASSAVSEVRSAAAVVPFTKLVRGTQSIVPTRTNYLITSASQLDELWKLIDAKEKPPTVDFSENTVAAVFAGEKAVAGSAITVLQVEDTDVRTVVVKLAVPTDCSEQRQTTVAPYELIMLPATSLSFAHRDLVATTSCEK